MARVCVVPQHVVVWRCLRSGIRSCSFLSTLYAVISQATAEQSKQNNVHNKKTVKSVTDIQCPEGTDNLGSSNITRGIKKKKKNGTTMTEQ